MPSPLGNGVERFLHCDVRCQLVLHDKQVINMFDTVLDRITTMNDGTMLVAYDGGAIHIADGEIVDHPTLLIIQGTDWSLIVTRWSDLPSDVERFPKASVQ